MSVIPPNNNTTLIIDDFINYATAHLSTVTGIINTISLTKLFEGEITTAELSEIKKTEKTKLGKVVSERILRLIEKPNKTTKI